jgi:Universal stress protein family
VTGAVFCGMDDSECSTGAAHVAREIAGRFGLPLVFVHVADPYRPHNEMEEMVALRRRADTDATAHEKATWKIEWGHPADRLVGMAREENRGRLARPWRAEARFPGQRLARSDRNRALPRRCRAARRRRTRVLACSGVRLPVGLARTAVVLPAHQRHAMGPVGNVDVFIRSSGCLSFSGSRLWPCCTRVTGHAYTVPHMRTKTNGVAAACSTLPAKMGSSADCACTASRLRSRHV